MISISPKDIRYLEKWANGLSKLDFLDPLLVTSAQNIVRSLKEDIRGDLMSNDKTEKALDQMQKNLWDRSPAPRLTPEQLNAIDLLILGKTDKEVAETIGIGRNTISKWYKNAFFIAELNVKREELWVDSKLRLRSLASEAVDVLSHGLHSSDEKISMAAAVHILKTVGLYDKEGKSSVTLPKTPEEAVWAQVVEEKTNYYKGSRPDALTDWSTRDWTEEVGKEFAAKMMDLEYEAAVTEQKKELKEYKKKTKAPETQPPLHQVEPVPMTIEVIEDDHSQAQNDAQEPITA
jgi:DNA-binding CsgD family transcriptional regulator